MMPEIASPDHDVSIKRPQDHDIAIAAAIQPSNDVKLAGNKADDFFDALKASPKAAIDAPPYTNGHVPNRTNSDNHDQGLHEGRPAKRRRMQDGTPPPSPSSARKPKPISPPWKKIGADGPTTFQENGRRKSGRINTLPLELQPPSTKRLTRGSLGTKASPSQAKKPTLTPNKAPSNRSSSARKSLSTPKPATKITHPPIPPSSTRKITLRSLRRRTPSPSSYPTRQNVRTRRSLRRGEANDAQDDPTVYDFDFPSRGVGGHSPRHRLHVDRADVIPLVHPDQVRKRVKIGTDFDDFWNRAGSITVEDGGLLALEDGPVSTDETALRDARIIMRIEQEVEPGGILSYGRCSLFAPEGEEEVPRQWARQDHMVKAMANFRKLLLAEQQRHRAAAKKLAEACRDEWVRRQPKTAEQLEAEARERWLLRYRLVARAISGTWENVRLQVNRQRLEEWEAEEQKRVKEALNEAVNLSEQKLQARRGGLDSEQPSDEDIDAVADDVFDNLGDSAAEGEVDENQSSDVSDAGNDDSGDELDSDVMSTSDEDEEDDDTDVGDMRRFADEGLTQEELRAKYANLPDLQSVIKEQASISAEASDTGIDATDDGDDSSDESVDMDDDLGSSDMDRDEQDGTEDDDGDDEEAEDESVEGEAGGLLGLFFGKTELKQMKQEASDEVQTNISEQKGAFDAMKDIASEGHVVGGGVTSDLNGHEFDTTTHRTRFKDQPPKTNDYEHKKHDDAEASDKARMTLNGVVGGTVVNNEAIGGDYQTGESGGRDLSNGNLLMADEHDIIASDLQQVEDANARKRQLLTLEMTPTSPAISPAFAQPHPSSSQSLENAASDAQSQASLEIMTTKQSSSRSNTPHSSSSSSSSSHKTEIPFLLRGTLREYQHDGLDWLAGLYSNNTNGILADEMGLGKTIQTIALLAHLACHHQVWGPHLVVVPTSVMLNWEMEFKKWCPGFKILAYYGSQEERKRKRQGWNNDDIWNVCITSYQLVLQDQQVFKRRRWHFMILDEAHNIKNFKSQRWQTLLGFNTRARLLLTGTPLQNNLTELWSLLFFLMPAENGVGGFADLQEFQDWFHKPESQILESGRDQMDEEAKAIISKLHKVLRPYLLRRLKADVEKQMPAKFEHVKFCRLSKRQRELYDGFLSKSETKEILSSGNYLSIINCLMQLRKVCNHPDLFIDRPIMTSFRMSKSVAAKFKFTEDKVRCFLADAPMNTVNLGFLNLIPTQHEPMSTAVADRVAQLALHRPLIDLREAQKTRAQAAYTLLDPSSLQSTISYLESASRWDRFEELQHCIYLNALRRQQRPIYGQNVINLVSIDAYKRPCRPKPKLPQKLISWYEGDLALIRALCPSLSERVENLKSMITKFSCVTPRVVTRDLEEVLLGRKAVQAFTEEDIKLSAPVRWAPFLPKQSPPDPWHEARMRHSIQFPDKRLLQYDCGKLQVLDKLLRELQHGGHRALIFTQMTKVLDILEQFLSIHGHKYLRLDGATKVEQRQILTDRFNNDSRILCFILSTRSGGLGINLTGADTVIFYDQDWNPAMDKQCQDRCHRIGQTRDVHIYRLVSEHTIEANILRKASQKQMLDDVVIQEGEFTTDYFSRVSVRDVLDGNVDFTSEGVAAADAALDRVLGGPDISRDQRTVGRALEQAEDREDVAAARVAEREIQADDADFTEKASGPEFGASTARQGTPVGKSVLNGVLDDDVEEAAPLDDVGEIEYNAWGQRMGNIDQYMVNLMTEELKETKLELPKDKKKNKKKGRDTRKR